MSLAIGGRATWPFAAHTNSQLQGPAREAAYAVASTRSSGMTPSCVNIDAESK